MKDLVRFFHSFCVGIVSDFGLCSPKLSLAVLIPVRPTRMARARPPLLRLLGIPCTTTEKSCTQIPLKPLLKPNTTQHQNNLHQTPSRGFSQPQAQGPRAGAGAEGGAGAAGAGAGAAGAGGAAEHEDPGGGGLETEGLGEDMVGRV